MPAGDTESAADAGRVMLAAGEGSGDRHGAALARALRDLRPGIEIEALGGPALEAEGVPVHLDLVSHAVMGFSTVLRRLPRYMRLLRRSARIVRRRRPDVLVPIDNPGLNVRLARRTRRAGIAVAYYVSPQVWAWRAGRIHTIARSVDRMLVLLPFEVELYRRVGVHAVFTGHPLLDELASGPPPAERAAAFRSRFAIPDDREILALLPGSRSQEVSDHLPSLLRAAEHLMAGRPEVLPVVSCAGPRLRRRVQRAVDARRCPAKPLVIDEDAHGLMAAARAAAVVSGTATLETAWFRTPLVAVYRVPHILQTLARRHLSTRHICLVNVVAGERVVPETFGAADPWRFIADHLVALWEDGPARERCLAGIERAIARFGEDSRGSATRAAAAILELVDEVHARRTTAAGGAS